MLRRKSEAQIQRRDSDSQRKPEVSNKTDVRRKSDVKNSRKSVKSISKPLRDYKFYFIESIRCGTYAGTLRSLIQELGGTTVAILPTLSKVADAEKAKTVIIIDTLENKPTSDSNKENLISPRESTSRDLLKLKLGNTRVLASRSKLMLNLAKSKNQEKTAPEDLEKTNKSEQDKYRIIAKKYKIHVFSRKGVHSWLRKQKEHTIKLALQEASNLCDPKSVPKIRPEGQAKVVDMLSQHRPRIFSTKHDMNYDTSKNPFRICRVNRSKNEILKKLSDKLEFSKTGYLAKKLSKINVWDDQDSCEKSVKKENTIKNRLEGSLLEKSLESLNFSNDSILKEIEFDNIDTIKKSVIKDINKNELAHEMKEGRKYCEVCKTQFDNVHWHWSTTLHTTAWEKSYEQCGDQFESIEQDLDDKFDFEKADSWEFNFGSELLNIEFQEKLLEEQNDALEEIRKDKIERDMIRKENQERNRAQLTNSWLMRRSFEVESKEVIIGNGVDFKGSGVKKNENVEFEVKSEENHDYEDDKPRLTQSEQDEDSEVCVISPKRERKIQKPNVINSTNSDSGWVKLEKAVSEVTESEGLRELDTDSEDITTGNNSGNKSPRIIEINSEKLTTDGFSNSRAATPNDEINNIRGTPRRKTRDLTDSKMHIHGDDFCYDNDDDGSSGLDTTVGVPSAFRNGRQVSGPGSRPSTPKSVRKVKIEHPNSNPNSRISTPTRKMTSTPKFIDSPKSTSVKRKRENGQIGSPFPKALKNMSPKIIHEQYKFVPSSAELAKTRRRGCSIKTDGKTPGSGTFNYSPNVPAKKITKKKKVSKQLKFESDSLESGEIRSEIVTSDHSNSSSVRTKVPRKLIITPPKITTLKFRTLISPTKQLRAVISENSAVRHIKPANMMPILCDYSQTDDSDTNSALSQISSSTCTQTSETSSYRRAPRRAVRDSKPPLLQALREKHQSEHINYLQLHDEAEWQVYNESGSASGMSTTSGRSNRSRRKQKQLN